MYADIPRGIFLIRGENVVMMAELGTIEECIEAERKRGLLGPVDVQQVLMLQKEELDRKERMQEAKKMIILEKGSDFEMDSVQFQ
jgi:3-keto-L-gulonate-6-phosphate decarboxylase